MSTAGLARTRLIWKELRQLWPLVGVSVLITVLLYLLVLLNNFNGAAYSLAEEILLVGLPGLFAVGIGALLVGQEKEQRTILWLQSLPIAKRELVRSKLIASLIGLASLWIVSLVLVTIFSGGEYWRAGSQLAGEASLLSLAVHTAHTLFLLLAGLAISWRVSSAFLALILLVPIAFVPYLMATLLSLLFSQSTTDAIGSVLLLAWQIVCCGIAGYWGWSIALKSLQPAATGRVASFKSAQTINLGLPYSQFSALLWQFAKQNRLLLMGIVSILLIAVFFTLVFTPSAISRQGIYSPLSILMIINFGLLGTSWLGVLVFQSDRLDRRIRFLADRGLSPAITWFSRHAIPVCVLSISLVLLLLAVARSTYASKQLWSSQLWGNSGTFTLEILSQLVIPVLLVALATYSVSQWIGQLLSSPIVAAVAAPITSVAAVIYLVFNFQSVGTPIALLSAVAFMPLVVTRILMRRWMDDRWDLNYWVTHATTVVLFIVLPAIPLAYAWLTSPSITTATQAALVEHLSKNGPVSYTIKELTLQLPKLREKTESEAGIGGVGIGGAGIDGPTVDAVIGTEAGPDAGLPAAEESVVIGSAVGGMLDTSEIVKLPTLDELTIQERSDYIRQSLNTQLDTSTGAVRVMVNVIQWLRSEMMINRLNALASAAAPELPKPIANGNSTVSAADRYQQLINLAARIAQRMRLTSQISDQELADRLEIVIVSELLQTKGTGLLDEATWANICKQIGDQSKRDTARRTAIAATWKQYEVAKYRNNDVLGLDRGRSPANLINYMTQRSRASHVVELLWQLSDSKLGNADSIRTQLATALSVSPASYGLGNQGKLQRADDPNVFLFESSETIRGSSLGSQWHAGWERLAEELAKETKAGL